MREAAILDYVQLGAMQDAWGMRGQLQHAPGYQMHCKDHLRQRYSLGVTQPPRAFILGAGGGIPKI